MANHPSRSRLRILAPLALAAAAVAIVVVVASSGGGGSGTSPVNSSDTSSTTTGKSTATTTKPKKKQPSTYTVKTGDNLGSIAQKTKIPVEKLQALNPALDPQAMVAGQKIKLKQ